VTTASLTLSEPRATPSAGRFVEFLLVGGATLFLFPLAWLLRALLGLYTAELAVGFVTFHAAHLINDPHFSVTYLLFYKDAKQRAFGNVFTRGQRIRYWIAGIVAPIVLAAWAIGALRAGSAHTLGLLIQLMFLLVGWHYVKQGFGVLAVLSARRGVFYTTRERVLILAHCFLGWAYAWASPFDPGKEVEEKGVVYRTIAHPLWLERVTLVAFVLSAVAVAAVLIQKVRRERRLPPLGPLGGFLITVWLLTVYTSLDPLMVYLIPALHSVQYLYFVWLLKRNEARAKEGPPAFGLAVRTRLALLAASALTLGFVLFHGAPAFFDGNFPVGDGSGLCGVTPWFAAIFAFVNIHHYFMDFVIWRRENPDTRFLKDANTG
jgi:hypothetical protein